MIQHHSGAILHDPENRELCKAIISSQQREIDQIVAKLREKQ